jgi:hypothetical protein
MKIYIVQKQEPNEYGIFRVADNLINEFEEEKKESILLRGNSISEVLLKFGEMGKTGIEFNSELAKYKLQQRDNLDENKMKSKPRINL